MSVDTVNRWPDAEHALAPLELQLGWLRELGFVDVDCFRKWRELALLAGCVPEP